MKHKQEVVDLLSGNNDIIAYDLRNRIHCLSSLLPPSNPANCMFNLRPRGHDLSFCQKVFV